MFSQVEINNVDIIDEKFSFIPTNLFQKLMLSLDFQLSY